MLLSKTRQLGMLLLLGSMLFGAAEGLAAEGKRAVHQTPPVTRSETTRRMGLSGVVRLEVTVTASGTVRSIKVAGGHPLLAADAVRAVRSWRWEPGREEVILLTIPFE